MNWAAGLYAGGVWMLAAGVWGLLRQSRAPEATTVLLAQVVRDVLPALLVALLFARLV